MVARRQCAAPPIGCDHGKPTMQDSNSNVAEVQGRETFGSPDQWLDALIAKTFEAIHTLQQDNFDASRYRDEAPNAFYFERHAWYFSFLLKNSGAFFRARQLLADEASRGLFDQLILFRVLGHLHVRLPFNTPENRAHLETAASWWVTDTADVGPYGPLSIYLVPGTGRDIRIKGWKENVTWTFLYRQYYFSRGRVEIRPEPGDHVIDAGGCFGDTAIGFADAVGSAGHVYVFDPLPRHCAIMHQSVAMNPELAPHISIFPYGLTDHVNDAPPLPADDRINPGARLTDAGVPTLTIDAAVKDHDVQCIDFIKMDIEGSELGALRGAESSLRRWRPKLAISLYHRPEDFFSIPTWIDSLNLGYRFFLEHYSMHQEETVLYAKA
jgi:FkbM family methyltransferase